VGTYERQRKAIRAIQCMMRRYCIRFLHNPMRTKTSLQRQLLARTAEATNLKDQAQNAQQDMERRLRAAEEDKKKAVSQQESEARQNVQRLQGLLTAAEEEKQKAVVTEQDRSQQLLFLLMTDVRQLDGRSYAMVYPSSHFPGHARFATSIDYKKDEVALVTVKDVRSGGRYKTSSFSLCGHEWNLVIDPAKEHEGKTAFGCYLHQKTSCDALKANYQIGMLSNTSGKDVVRQSTQCFTDGFGWGGSFASDQELQERTSAGEPHSRYASAAPTQPCCAVRLLRRRRLLCPRS